MKLTTIILLFAAIQGTAQSSKISQFAIWKAKEGKLLDLENGYKKHLEWHRTNGDTWSWYGWYFMSGPRAGQFIDATFDHSWNDFDKAVKPAADMADNFMNVFPYGDIQSVFKTSAISHLSIIDSTGLTSRLQRLITLNVSGIPDGMKLIQKLLVVCQRNWGVKTFLTFKLVDGGDLNQMMIMIGFNSNTEFGKSENIEVSISAIEKELKTKIIRSVTSETLVYRPDLSYFPN